MKLTSLSKSSIIVLVFLLFFINALLIVIPSYSAESTKNPLLADMHAKKNVNCQGCHKEEPPAKPVTTDTCFKCHGNPTKVVQRTEKLVPNPHTSPHESPSDVKCESCHHMHKPSQNSCAQCHNEIIFKVP
jgi:hypothetical protein